MSNNEERFGTKEIIVTVIAVVSIISVIASVALLIKGGYYV